MVTALAGKENDNILAQCWTRAWRADGYWLQARSIGVCQNVYKWIETSHSPNCCLPSSPSKMGLAQGDARSVTGMSVSTSGRNLPQIQGVFNETGGHLRGV